MSGNPHTNGGLLLRDLAMPDFRAYAAKVSTPGGSVHEPTRVLGELVRDVIAANPTTFRLMGPDETASNRLGAAFEVTDRTWLAETLPGDDNLAPDGRVMEVLSEHLCEGWLEGYLLTGRHGLFNCYEAFIHIIDSMFNQHAKWLKVTRDIPWRRPIASLNYLLSSHVWRQDHNGFSHQDPGFIDHVVNKKAEIIRVYLPPDTNTLLSVADHCLRSRNYVNVIVAGKNPTPDWLSMDDAVVHCTRGLGIWDWAGTHDEDGDPDVVLGCAGDVPTLETLAAADLLRRHLPDLKVRVVNVVDLMRLQDASRAPARPLRPGVRHVVHPGQAGGVRLPRLPVAHPPPHLPAGQPRQHPRPRLQGGGHHHDTVRHGDAQRPRPLPPRHRRHRPGAGPRVPRGPAAPADGRRAAAAPRVHPRARRGLPRDPRLAVARRRCAGMRVLTVNAGSSSVKLRVLDADDQVLDVPRTARPSDLGGDVADLLDQADAVGHRVVHGGPDHVSPELVTDALVADLRGLTDLAPLHQPVAVDAIEAVRRAAPDVPAVACFDTAFHADLPAAARTYALPREWRERHGLRRYGFHGLSYAYASRRAAELLGPGRPAPGRRAPRVGGVVGRRTGWAVDGHHDGLHAARGPGDGDPVRRRSTRGCCCGWSSTAG